MYQLIKRAVTRYLSPAAPAPTVTYIMEADLVAFCREVSTAVDQHYDELDLVMLQGQIDTFRDTYRVDRTLLQKHLAPVERRIAYLRAELESRKAVPAFRNR